MPFHQEDAPGMSLDELLRTQGGQRRPRRCGFSYNLYPPFAHAVRRRNRAIAARKVRQRGQRRIYHLRPSKRLGRLCHPTQAHNRPSPTPAAASDQHSRQFSMSGKSAGRPKPRARSRRWHWRLSATPPSRPRRPWRRRG